MAEENQMNLVLLKGGLLQYPTREQTLEAMNDDRANGASAIMITRDKDRKLMVGDGAVYQIHAINGISLQAAKEHFKFDNTRTLLPISPSIEVSEEAPVTRERCRGIER